MNIFPLNLTESTDKLKKLIAKYPDYPIVILAGDCANSGDYSWMYCCDITFDIAEILDCETPFGDDIVATERYDFNERLEEWLWDELGGDMEENEFQKVLKKEKEKYEPYWKKVIAIYATN